MKKIIRLVLILLISNLSIAQVPQGIPYQAVARSSSGAILASTPISIRFSIHDSTSTGTVVYQETFHPTTNAQGMFNVNIGQGAVVVGTFSGINWGANSKFMQVEMDPAGGTSYIDMGITQMMSVPYALFAGKASSILINSDGLSQHGSIIITRDTFIVFNNRNLEISIWGANGGQSGSIYTFIGGSCASSPGGNGAFANLSYATQKDDILKILRLELTYGI